MTSPAQVGDLCHKTGAAYLVAQVSDLCCPCHREKITALNKERTRIVTVGQQDLASIYAYLAEPA